MDVRRARGRRLNSLHVGQGVDIDARRAVLLIDELSIIIIVVVVVVVVVVVIVVVGAVAVGSPIAIIVVPRVRRVSALDARRVRVVIRIIPIAVSIVVATVLGEGNARPTENECRQLHGC